jgi:hypothetical protein
MTRLEVTGSLLLSSFFIAYNCLYCLYGTYLGLAREAEQSQCLVRIAERERGDIKVRSLRMLLVSELMVSGQ